MAFVPIQTVMMAAESTMNGQEPPNAAVVDDEERRPFVALRKDDVALVVVDLLQPLRQRREVVLGQRLEERNAGEQFTATHCQKGNTHSARSRLAGLCTFSRERRLWK